MTPQDQGAQAQKATNTPNTPPMRSEPDEEEQALRDAQINEGAQDAQERGEQQKDEENQQIVPVATATTQPNEASP